LEGAFRVHIVQNLRVEISQMTANSCGQSFHDFVSSFMDIQKSIYGEIEITNFKNLLTKSIYIFDLVLPVFLMLFSEDKH
jgi:hypothetical protein